MVDTSPIKLVRTEIAPNTNNEIVVAAISPINAATSKIALINTNTATLVVRSNFTDEVHVFTTHFQSRSSQATNGSEPLYGNASNTCMDLVMT